MGQKQKRMPGLLFRSGVWHLDKQVGSGRICESTGTGDLQEAQRYLVRRLDEIRQAAVYGVRPDRTFRVAATRYLKEFGDKRAISRDAQDIKLIDVWIGDLLLPRVHMGSLLPFIESRKREGRAAGTINRTLAVVRHILDLCAKLWRDEFGLTWLETAPMIQLLDDRSKRKAYPLSWAEEELLIESLPLHLREMALFAINTGCRESEVCQLRWDWEMPIPELEASVFVIPDWLAKNGKERVVVLNRIAAEIVERNRGVHPERVFTYRDEPVTKIDNSAWKRARQVAADGYPARLGSVAPSGFENLRVHDLRHTFGRRMRSVGVTLEDRQDLLGHESGRMTTHYSSAEIRCLIEAANRICSDESRKSPAITFLRISDRQKNGSNALIKGVKIGG